MEFLLRFSVLRLVKPATAEMSDTELFPRNSLVRLVNPATAEMSDTELIARFSVLRLGQARYRRYIRDVVAPKIQRCQVG